MLIHDNGKICVLSHTRCGHTSMYSHFGLPPHSNTNGLDVWMNTTSRRVLVLRNPYDRYMSAYNAAHKRAKEVKGFDVPQWIFDHTLHYLQNIQRTVKFDIIDFYKLPLYIDKHDLTITTESDNYTRHDVPNTREMRQEYLAYQYFMKHCDEISPEEWRELTT